MAPLPDFANTALFPSFYDLPTSQSPSTPPTTDKQEYYLLAQVKNNMTITKPTLTLTDRTHTTEFALVFDGLGRDDLDLARLGLKKGNVAVIPNAVRTGMKKGEEDGKEKEKQGFVRIPLGEAGSVRVIPGSLGRVLEVGGWEGKVGVCGRCGKCDDDEGKEGGEGGGKNVVKGCTGCGRVGYCCKECQIKDWTEGGHKTDCKMFKALNDIFGH